MLFLWRSYIRSNERGSASTAIGVMIFLPMLALAMGAMRMVQMNGDVASAARFSARAASLTYQPSAAEAEAGSVAEDTLADRGINCEAFGTKIIDITLGANGIIAPGSTITVEVTCTVDLSSSLVAGFPGSQTITVPATAKVDNIRGGGVAVVSP